MDRHFLYWLSICLVNTQGTDTLTTISNPEVEIGLSLPRLELGCLPHLSCSISDGWMVGQMDDWMDGQMVEWMDGRMGRCMEGYVVGWIDG